MKTKPTLYLYPITGRRKDTQLNPYILYLADELDKHCEVVNLDRPSKIGFLDIFRYLRGLDYIHFNWIEDLPEKFLGRIQLLAFFPLFLWLQWSGTKMIWTLHNKASHSTRHLRSKQKLLKFLYNRCDLIITHAKEGLELIPDGRKKIYIPHPVKPIPPPAIAEKKNHDIVIWGSITPYKRADEFMKYLDDHALLAEFRILIAGRISDPGTAAYLEGLGEKHPNIDILNRYVEYDELSALIQASHIILFPYHPGSILSSGALMDSLNFNAWILGPDVGAFRDLAGMGIIRTFSDFRDLVESLRGMLSGRKDMGQSREKREAFMKRYSWEHVGDLIYRSMLRLNQGKK